MTTVDTGAPHRRGLTWAVETARIAIAVAIVGQIVISTIPGRLIYATTAGSFYFDSWAYFVVVFVSALSAIASIVAIAMLPLVAVWVLTHPPNWVRAIAVVAGLVVGFLVAQTVALTIPALSYWAELQWLATPAERSVFSILLFVPFMVQTWIGVLVLIAVVCGRAERPMLSGIAGLVCLIILGLTLARFYEPFAPQGKALVLVAAGVWLWVTAARTGAISPGAQPWGLALLAAWTLPEVFATLPLLIDAMQIISPSARWGMVAQIFAQMTIGNPLNNPVLILLILLAVLHMAFETAKPSVWDIVAALLIALGLILPEIARQWGYPSGFGPIVSMGRTGALETGTAILAGIAALSWRLAQLAMLMALVRLIRLPLSQIVAR